MNHKISPMMQFIMAWFGLPFIAVFNGILRELTYKSVIGDEHAHQVSAILLSIIICFYVIILNSRVTLRNWREAFAVGLIWLALTVLFEFALGAARGLSREEQMSSYDLLHGNLWTLVLLTVLLAPVVLRKQKMIRLLG